jgi:hypothetical protein
MADMRAMEEQAERMNPISGKGATPSMGLSQFRGGAKKKGRIAKMEAAAPSEYLHEMDEMAEMPSGEYEGAGKQHGQLFGRLLSKLHGGAYASSFMHGMTGGLRTGRYEGEGKLVIQHLDSGHGTEVHSGGAMTGAGVIGAGVIGAGTAGAGTAGAGMCGARAIGAGRKPVGPEDGRRKRAEVVRKVMKEKGLSLGAASKYVKEHGLY